MSKEVPMVTITRSFGRKLNMSAHGGKQYETADIFISLTTEVPGNEIKESSAQLDKMCQKEVQKTIDAFDASEDEDEDEEVAEEAPKKKKKVDVGMKVEQDEFEAIQEYVNDLTLSKTSRELAEAVAKIKKNAEEFTKTEQTYLSSYYKKRKAAIEAAGADEEEEEEDEEDEEDDE